MKFIFTADLHGNAAQLAAVVQYAEAHGLDAILLGGDLSPRRRQLVQELGAEVEGDAVLAGQGHWLRSVLLPILQRSRVPSYLIFGNSDCRANLAPLRQDAAAAAPHVHILWNEAMPVAAADGQPAFTLLGFSLVPPSNHRLKDQERIDISEEADRQNRAGQPMVIEGAGTLTGAFAPITLRDHGETLEQALDRVVQQAIADGMENSRAIWMLHAPPNRTHADLTPTHGHVGSMAIRQAIERCQPLVTLHGHIHETVDQSGAFSGRLGASVVLAAGNNFHADHVACLVVDTDAPANARRIHLPAPRPDPPAHPAAPSAL